MEVGRYWGNCLGEVAFSQQKREEFNELTVAIMETSNDIRKVAIMIPAKML